MALLDSLIGFAVSLLVGALGIYVGARVVTGTDDYAYAVITAFIGSVVWAIVAFLVGWIPLLGPILALVAWVGVINLRYPGGWANAAAIGLLAWIAVMIVLWILAIFEIVALEVIGVPGV